MKMKCSYKKEISYIAEGGRMISVSGGLKSFTLFLLFFLSVRVESSSIILDSSLSFPGSPFSEITSKKKQDFKSLKNLFKKSFEKHS